MQAYAMFLLRDSKTTIGVIGSGCVITHASAENVNVYINYNGRRYVEGLSKTGTPLMGNLLLKTGDVLEVMGGWARITLSRKE